MTWPAVWAAALAMTAAPAANPDPQTLAIPPADRAKAESLVKLLGSPAFRDRDRATRELAQMGRLALPAVQAGLTAADTEVRAKCEWLYPTAMAADQQARAGAFLADVDGKFAHDLPGWNELRAASGNTPAARKLFVDILEHKPNASLVAGFAAPTGLPLIVASRRAEIYTRMYGIGQDRTQTKPTVNDVAGLLLAEILTTGTTVRDQRYNFATSTILSQAGPVRDALTGTGPGVEPFRKLVARWMQTRTEMLDIYSAMSAAASLDLKEVSAAALAEKLLAGPADNVASYRMYALGTLARTEDKKYLPSLRKRFGDTGSLTLRQANKAMTVQVGDCALAFTLQMLGRKPEEYGFETTPFANAGGKYVWTSYGFLTDEKRKFGFMKFVWEEAREKAKK